ncbi:Lrp/AsnC family transcriptional regulator [Streptomyces sp. NPDC053542]|uniref:Lrp/AsnC family transcriptional regulator n=1 Tax=Streptomyces sp. NPDC053542 TaxID=3365710 RepID=UPI0037CF67F1
MDLDELDIAILRSIQTDARQTNRELAASVGVAPSTSLERLRSLRRRGVVEGFTANVNFSAIGRPVQALISVRIRPPSRRVLESFREWVRTFPEVVGLFVTTGNEDFLLHMAVPSTERLYDFVIDRLTERREVADVRTSIVYEHLQNRLIEPVVPQTRDPQRRRGAVKPVGQGDRADRSERADRQDRGERAGD